MLPAEELRYLILAAQREGNRWLGRELKPLGVTSAQAEVLRILQERQPLTLTGLGELLVCESGNNPSRLVDRLTAVGLVDRRVAAHDRRHVELTLTDEGMGRARQITEIESELYRLIEAAADGRDLNELSGFLRAFVADLPSGRALSRRVGPAGS
jgi:MarR family transcriptional regulator, organic hydroperoxide resistance regulator